jgi:hypothetical protein
VSLDHKFQVICQKNLDKNLTKFQLRFSASLLFTIWFWLHEWIDIGLACAHVQGKVTFNLSRQSYSNFEFDTYLISNKLLHKKPQSEAHLMCKPCSLIRIVLDNESCGQWFNSQSGNIFFSSHLVFLQVQLTLSYLTVASPPPLCLFVYSCFWQRKFESRSDSKFQQSLLGLRNSRN